MQQSEALSARLDHVRKALIAIDQAHVLTFANELSSEALAAFLDQIEGLGIHRLASWAKEAVIQANATVDAFEPAQYRALHDRDRDADQYRSIGQDLLRAGKVAAFVVAGGQGTRLGLEGPKGMFAATPLRKLSLFQSFAEQLLAARQQYGVSVPWYVMTSPLNHDQTAGFFAQNDFFGLDPHDVFFLTQGVLPSYDFSGRLLLSEPGCLATHPDGHGGSLRALVESGAIEDMRRRGIEQLSYFQVDNPLVSILDPLFLGLHVAAPNSSCEMSAKTLRKRNADEPVGVFVQQGHQTRIIEYSNMPKALQIACDSQGHLLYDAGNPAIHLLSVAFIEHLMARGDLGLPLNRAKKIVPHIDLQTGAHVTPSAPNAIKLEAFVFDALPFAKSVALLEIDRFEEFAPIKNSMGADSPQTSMALQAERAARHLEAYGIRMPRKADGSLDCVIEITAQAEPQLHQIQNDEAHQVFESGAQYLLCVKEGRLQVDRLL